MKNTQLTNLLAGTFVLLSFTFSSCSQSKGNNNEEQESAANSQETTKELDTNIDKYIGYYHLGNRYDSFTIGKFTTDLKAHATGSDKYYSLDNSLIGKYYIVNLYRNVAVSGIANTGNILLGVEPDGTIHIQNYSYSDRSEGNSMDLKLSASTRAYGKFVPGTDGKYNLVVNNATYQYSNQ